MTVEARISALDPLSRRGARARSLLLLGGGRGGSRRSRVGFSSRPSSRATRASTRGRRRGRLRPPGALEPDAWERAPACRRRERRTCCRTSCRRTELITSRFSPTRCASSSPCDRARRSSTRPSAPAATRAARGGPRAAAASSSRSTATRARSRTSTGSRPRAGVDVRFLRGDFAIVLSQLAANGVKADAILLDLGIWSMQVDRPERGFSYATDAPLDMRMDPSSEMTAAAIVDTWDERELVDDLPPLRRGAVRGADRPRDRAAPRRAPVHAHGRPRRRDQARDPDAGALRRGPPGAARLPGAPDRRQRRARPARGGAPRRARDAPAGRQAGGHLVPLARGPDREALLRRAGEGLHVPARVPDLRLRQGADAAAARRASPSARRRDETEHNPRAASARLRAAVRA